MTLGASELRVRTSEQGADWRSWPRGPASSPAVRGGCWCGASAGGPPAAHAPAGRTFVRGLSGSDRFLLGIGQQNGLTAVLLTLERESQHSKFAAVLHHFDLFEPGGEERYYAPWRPDPRPLIGLFHGA
jgi:hypothetical protein